MSQSKGQIDRDCTDKCRSVQHGYDLCKAITKRGVTDEELCSYLRWKCTCCGQVTDSMGRTALHFAASCGRMKLLKWLVKNKGAQINAKDLESGYTALHRSIFYGKINTAVYLIQLGANCSLLDHNDLTPFEHAMKDRISRAQYNLSSSCQAYVWGTNTNYTLGTGSQHAIQQPDLHNAFHKKYNDVSVAQVCMAKFHYIIVSRDGRVFSCGHGHGGRLGLNTENTVLIPQELQFNSTALQFSCIEACIGRDHSLFLSKTGQVWSCGLNTHHVLGIKPPPAQLLVPKSLSEFRTEIKGICTGRFHSVAWGSNAVYSWGLHAGQLGHDRTPNNITYITPKLVSNFSNQDIEIVYVAASDGATVVSTKKGDVFVLHEYQCRRIASKQLNIEKIIVVGGHLNSKLSNDILTEKGGKELRVLVLQTTGNLLVWQESWPQLSRCIYTLNRSLIVTDAVLSRTELFFVTIDGEAYKGEFRTRKKKLQENSPNTNKTAFHEFLDKDECQIIKVHKFSNIHRAVKIHCDLKGRNFTVIQNSPQFLLVDIPEVSKSNMAEDMCNLLNNSDEMDAIHDVMFKVSGYMFPAHRYIISFKSDALASLIESNATENAIELSNINPVLFKQILLYIYTGTCDILTCGECSLEIKNICNNKENNNFKSQFDNTIFDEDENMSAFEYYNDKKMKKPKCKESNSKNDGAKDPVRMLQQAAKRFGIKSLYKKLDNYIYINGFIQIKTKNQKTNEIIKFDRNVFKNLQDVVVKSNSGAEIPAHKCILAGRLEYFNNLFAVRWNENSKRSVISLPISYSVLESVIDFLYTDDAKNLKDTDDIDHISNVLVIADQLFIERLKEICEVTLSGLLTLKNVAHMLQFASVYNSVQLKRCTMEFICLNLSAVLETRMLDILDSAILNDLTDYYCNWNNILSKRIITPFSDAPSDEEVKKVYDLFPVKAEDSDQENSDKKTPKLNSKRKIRTRKSSSSENMSNRTLSESNMDNSLENNSFIEPLETLNESKNTPIDDKWVKIKSEKEKHQKIVQTRLRAIASAKEELNSEKLSNNFTKLSLRKSNTINDTSQLLKSGAISTSSSASELPLEIAKSPPVYEIPIQKVQKLSQKQRKKLAAEVSTGNLGQDLEKINKKQPWNSFVWSKDSNSFADIMKGEIKDGNSKEYPELCTSSPKNSWQKLEITSPVSSVDTKQDFMDIIADERKQKENWTKMRARPLIYSQMEDKAISDLERFYNINKVSDEYITIHKVDKGVFAVPLWVQAKH